MTTTGAPGPQGGSIEGSIQSTTWLQEWNYGKYEGLTVADIRNRRGQTENEEWSIWKEGCPGGECVSHPSLSLSMYTGPVEQDFMMLMGQSEPPNKSQTVWTS